MQFLACFSIFFHGFYPEKMKLEYFSSYAVSPLFGLKKTIYKKNVNVQCLSEIDV